VTGGGQQMDQHEKTADIIRRIQKGEELIIPPPFTGNLSSTAYHELLLTSHERKTPSCHLSIQHIVSESDLNKPEELKEIADEVREECQEWGQVQRVVIPTKGEKGAGFVYVSFHSIADASKAKEKLSGRCFSGKELVVDYAMVDQFNSTPSSSSTSTTRQ